MAEKEYFDDWSETKRKQGEEREKEGEGLNSAFTFLCITCILTLFGLIMLYSSSYDEALSHGLPHYYYLVRQCIYVALAIVCAFIIKYVPFSFYKTIAYPSLALSIILVLLTLFTPLGATALGARRWLRIGPVSLQTVELLKVAMIFAFARWFSTDWKNKVVRYLPPVLMMFGCALLILLQKDFSSMVVFVGLCLSLLVAGGISIGALFLIIAVVAVPAAIAMLSAPYRVSRIASFLFPNLDKTGANWQVDASLSAIRKGGLFGSGLGNGTYKLGVLPEVQNDFIFANLCEEMGMIWALFIIALFVLYAILGYRCYERVSKIDPFLAYLDFGMTTMVVWQAAINMAVVTGLLPPTGIPLPFFSQGGTNLFFVLVCSAIMYRIMLVSSGRIPLEKSHLSKEERNTFVFPPKGSIPS